MCSYVIILNAFGIIWKNDKIITTELEDHLMYVIQIKNSIEF